MTRRELLAAAAAVHLWPVTGDCQIYRDYSRCLPDYLRRLAEDAYQRRKTELGKLTHQTAIRARQQWVAGTFWELVGGMPARTPLNARVTGSFDRAGYRLEKVVFESQPRFHVSANLYLPSSGVAPFPAVLFQMGHSVDGKASGLYQRCCQGLARLGFVVLGFDPMGQGERTYYPGSAPSRSRLGADEEHTYPGRQMLLSGITSTRLQTWDAVRALDYLAAHPMVDPKRLASTGQSGGGTNTMFLAAVDDRLAAAAISCPNTENIAAGDFNPPGSTDDGEQNFVNGGPAGFDRWDLLYPFAPKPLLIAVSERDFFGTYSPNYIRNGREEYDTLHSVYQTLGHADHIDWFGTPLPHGLAYEMRLKIYNWFTRWLKNDPRPILEEPPAEPETESALFVSAPGNVVEAFGGETPFSLNRAYTVVPSKTDLSAILSIDQPAAPDLRVLSKTAYRSAAIEAVEFPSAPGVWIPAWLFRSKNAAADNPVVLVLDPSGRTAWHEGELYDRLVSAGCVACAADVRGIGDLTPEFGRGSARHAREHNSDEHYAWSSLVLGKPLAGQRVTDILAAIRGLRTRFRGRLVIAARGAMTVPALFAAAIDSSIDALYLAGGLVSFRSVVETRDYRHPMGNFVPHLLEHTDLPEIAASVSPRKIKLAGAVDAAGRAMPVDKVRSVYASANVDFGELAWDAAALSDFAHQRAK